ncbi:MAG TPA: MerR family transcriptional regulator [Dehalococcoidia bacterium]|nr:MerR family transcriptional regulator [Dehalococcoidia bacterium]
MTDSRPVAPDAPCLQIGEVADRTGVTQRTLRFYEERGLLKPPTRMEGGFRLYSEDDVSRVEQIKRLQNLLGLTLAEIKDMVEAEEAREGLNATYRPDRPVEERIERVCKRIDITQRQHAIIAAKLDAMLEMRADLEEKLQRYNATVADLQQQLESSKSNA